MIADAILDGLGEAHCVVCPGSRNGPLLLALQQRGLPHTLVIDERSAGFHALGYAMMGRRAVVITTSGTATANLLPAVVEAHQSDLPVVFVTADRPASVRDTGTNQTIEQPGLYGSYVRAEADVPVDATPEEAERAAAHAMRTAVMDHGPAHLNVQFAKPLEPAPNVVQARASMAAPARRVFDVPTTPVPATTFDGRGLIIAGPRSPPLPDTGVPVLADCLSGHRPKGIAHADVFAHLLPRPDWILQVGRLPTSKNVQDTIVRWCAEGTRRVRVDTTGRGWDGLDAPCEMISFASGHAGDFLAGLDLPEDDAYADLWARADAAVPPVTGEAAVPARFAAHVGGTVYVGNSLPVRDMERHLGHDDVRVVSNRGASGIDGQIATAATMDGAVIGDVSFQHDVGSLALWGDAPLVVLNNGGGRIFDHLPVAKQAPEHMDLFRSPPQVDIGKAAAAFGLSHATMNPDDPFPSAQVIEVLCGPTDRAAWKEAAAAAVLGALS